LEPTRPGVAGINLKVHISYGTPGAGRSCKVVWCPLGRRLSRPEHAPLQETAGGL